MAGSKGGKGGGAVQSIFGPRGGGGGGGIFDRLREQFPQFMPQQQPQFTPFGQQPVGETFAPPQAQPFAGPQPILQPQPPGQAVPFGQAPVGETFRPQQSGGIARPQQQPGQFAPAGQPILRQGPPQQPGLPPGVTQLGPEAIISEGFGLPQNPAPSAQRFQGPLITESFAPTRPAPEALLQSPRSPLGPLVDPRGNRSSGKNFAF